jgi:SAM-dependent methyltransferase
MTMLKEEIQAKVAQFAAIQPWNHNFDLPHGVQTRAGEQKSHGKNLVKLERLRPLFDALGVPGKRVLDVGCNEGFFSLHLAERGAHVMGTDIDKHRIEKARFIHSVLGRHDVDFQVMDIYSQEFAHLPVFDLCLCLGFLHRVPDPFSALAALGTRTNLIVLEWKALKFGPHDDAFAYFTPKPVDSQDYYGTEYWLLSYAAVERILRRLGFSYFHRVDDPRQRRALLVAGKVDNPVFRLPDQILHRGRVPALLSHTKRYLRTLVGILTGRVNA